MLKDFSMHILDIAQNSIKSGATTIVIKIIQTGDKISLMVVDNGSGMTQERLDEVMCKRLSDKGSGRGIPMLRELCNNCEGFLSIKSKLNGGTFIKACMRRNHANSLPMGKLEDTIYALIVTNLDIDFLFIYKCNGKIFECNTRKMKKALGDVSIANSIVMKWLQETLSFEINSAMNRAQ